MYRTFLNTHLFLGLFCFLFLMTYGASSIQMAHGNWFDTRPTVTVKTVSLPPALTDVRIVARDLSDSFGVQGELAQIKTSPRDLRFNLSRAGSAYQITYHPATGETEVRDSRAAFMFMLNRIHQMSGIDHNYWLTNAWGALVIVVSAALILMGLTGIYLWFKMKRERTIGVVLLAVSLGYSLTLLVLVRTGW